MTDDDSEVFVEFISRFFPVANTSQLAARERMFSAWPTTGEFFDYFGAVTASDMPVDDLRRITKSPMVVHTRLGQPVVPLVRFPIELGASGAEALPWTSVFLPTSLVGRRSSIRHVAYGRVKRVRDAGVPVEYAAALHAESSTLGVAAEDIIRLWNEGVPCDFAVELMP